MNYRKDSPLKLSRREKKSISIITDLIKNNGGTFLKFNYEGKDYKLYLLEENDEEDY